MHVKFLFTNLKRIFIYRKWCAMSVRTESMAFENKENQVSSLHNIVHSRVKKTPDARICTRPPRSLRRISNERGNEPESLRLSSGTVPLPPSPPPLRLFVMNASQPLVVLGTRFDNPDKVMAHIENMWTCACAAEEFVLHGDDLMFVDEVLRRFHGAYHVRMGVHILCSVILDGTQFRYVVVERNDQKLCLFDLHECFADPVLVMKKYTTAAQRLHVAFEQTVWAQFQHVLIQRLQTLSPDSIHKVCVVYADGHKLNDYLTDFFEDEAQKSCHFERMQCMINEYDSYSHDTTSIKLTLADAELEKHWRAYHRAHAKLVTVQSGTRELSYEAQVRALQLFGERNALDRRENAKK